jgi:simple sugar transport system permease protein
MSGAAIREKLAAPAAAIAAGAVVLYLGLTLTGFDGVAALAAMYRGGLGSADAIVSSLLPRAIPLILIGLGIGVSFRAGALNIGAEGQFYAGAMAATWLALSLASWPRLLAVPLVLSAGLLAGALWAALPTLLRLRFGVLEVITSLLLNFVADALVSWAVQGPLQESTHIYPQSNPLPGAARLPVLPGARLHLGLAIALMVAVGLWAFSRRTLIGFQLRAAGENPVAARVIGGVDTRRLFAVALLGSGALAGLAGAGEVSGTTFALFQNLSPGYGFTAIAVALLARLDPIATVFTGMLFAAIEAGASAMQREAGVPAVAAHMVEATITIVVLLADAARRRRTASVEG